MPPSRHTFDTSPPALPLISRYVTADFDTTSRNTPRCLRAFDVYARLYATRLFCRLYAQPRDASAATRHAMPRVLFYVVVIIEY